MHRQGALADAPLAGAHSHEMAHPGEPFGDAGALLGNLLEDSGTSVADDVVVALHFKGLPGLPASLPRLRIFLILPISLDGGSIAYTVKTPRRARSVRLEG